MEDAGADCVYVVDSAGAMTMHDARARVAELRAELRSTTQVGIHAHNNLSLAVANSVGALEEGADQVDGCSRGLGAGAGNCPTEVLVAVSELLGWRSGVDPLRIMDVAEDVVRPIMPREQVIDRTALTLGYAGVYSSFLLHTEKAASRFGVDAREILLELGEDADVVRGRKLVYGKGCDRCHHTGYRGRTGLFEIMTIDEEIRKAMLARASTQEIRAAAVASGMKTLRKAGVEALLASRTTIEEVLRETGM
jgi:isopropylmalate/homocitrate/citramalate synthase